MTAPILRQRNAHAGDMPYVLSTWMRSYAAGESSSRRKQATVDYRRRYVDRIMAADPHIVVLCSPTSHSTLLGHAVALDGVLCWVYVTKDLRRVGYAKQVIAAALSGYPDTIKVHWAWPFPSNRFKFERLAIAA